MPIDDAFWGDRCGGIEDPFGHKWMIATHKKDVPEMARNMVSMLWYHETRSLN